MPVYGSDFNAFGDITDFRDDLTRNDNGDIQAVNSGTSAAQITDLLNSGKSPEEILRELASQDESYLGQYLETLISRQDTASARSFSEWMDSSKYSRAFEDIKKAGYNPWLALQGGLGVSGSQEYSAARTSSSNAFSLKSSRKSADASELNSKRQMATSIISAVSSALMLAILMMA